MMEAAVYKFVNNVHRRCLKKLMWTHLNVMDKHNNRYFSIYHWLRKESSDDESETKKDAKKSSQKNKYKDKEEPVSAISSKLIEQILSMKTVENITDAKLDLAKPINRREEKQAKKKIIEELKKEAPGLSIDLIQATKEVAQSVGGNTAQTKSDLLSKLLKSTTEASATAAAAKVGDILSGMKVNRNEVQQKVKFFREADVTKAKGNLFGSSRLNIFNKAEVAQANDLFQLNTWDKLEERERELLVTQPPKNAFEEEIQWLKQGKVWQFPIDNEQGMDDEKRCGFHEHVFLEPLIADFNKKGPIRHFMELVLVGLSKNPYLTVNEKKADIEWFRQYFKDKQSVVPEIQIFVEVS